MCLLGAEFASRAFLEADRFYVWPPNITVIYDPAPGVMPGIHGTSVLRTSSLGLRSDELPEDDAVYRVLAVGGSTTEGSFLDQTETWPQVAQDVLNTGGQRRHWVGNLGASGKNSRDHVLQLKHLLPRYPRIDAVVALVGVNDLSLRLKRDVHYDPNYMRRPGAEARQLLHAFWRVPFSYETAAYKRTALYHLAREAKNVVKAHLVDAAYIDTAGLMYRRWREHRRRAGELRDQLPDLASALAEYRRNLEALADLSAASGARLVLATQPSVWRADMTAAEQERLWLGGVGDYQELPGQPYYTVGALADGMRRYNEVLMDTCRQRDVECLDLAAALPRTTATFYDDVHFTEAGSARVGRLVAAHLEP